jgi:hypothetical protein
MVEDLMPKCRIMGKIARYKGFGAKTPHHVKVYDRGFDAKNAASRQNSIFMEQRSDAKNSASPQNRVIQRI